MQIEEVFNSARKDAVRLNEIKNFAMAHGNISMRYGLLVKGEKPVGGFPLYIALHGGGQCDTPDLNDSQWDMMKSYYLGGVISGVYVAPRGIRDTWDTHFNPESYYFYKRLIQNMILFYGVNPDKVYLLGYSAGGDGVYQISARMADYFAAADMSAGHPNGVSLTNVKNMPLYIQCGELDDAYARNDVTVQYAKDENVMDAFIHKGKYHHILDNSDELQLMTDGRLCDTNAVRLVSKWVRNTYPKEIARDLSLKSEDMFYYTESFSDSGKISVKRDENVFKIEGNVNNLYLNEDFVDFNRQVVVYYNGEKRIYEARRDDKVIYETALGRFDRSFVFSYKIKLEERLI